MTVERLPSRRRQRPAPVSRSHEEIYDLVVRAVEAAERADKKATDAVGRADLMHGATQRVEGKLDTLLKTLGSEGEDERGERIGTGVVGRLMRLEVQVAKRFGLYDGWTKLTVGFTAAVVVLGPVIWWLLSDKLTILLK